MDTLEKQAETQQISSGDLNGEINATYTALDKKQTGKRLFAKDSSLWESDTATRKLIDNRLGWLSFPDSLKKDAEELMAFSQQIKQEGYKYAVLLGMGGSSLCSEVARETFGTSNGYLELLVLDNTSPEAIHDIEKHIDIEKTLFISASKSGATKETLSFSKYFYELLKVKLKDKTGNNFVAITDAGTPLVKMAQDYNYRKVFINPGDVGGRYSVLSDFGLLPMALMGIDISALLLNAKQLEDSCAPAISTSANPGLSLGGLLGLAQQHGKDKVTFVLSQSIQAFGYWVEQLIAESTGKEGKGLIPVNGEQLGNPDVYGNDRIFVHIYLNSDDNIANIKKLSTLEQAGNPIVRIELQDKMALGGEYYRWEVATAIAGMIIGINPFDEPNVAESKKNTKDLLEEWQKKGDFSKPTPVLSKGNISIYSGTKTLELITKNNTSIESYVKAFTTLAQPGDYIALLPYFLKTNTRNKVLEQWRQQLRDNYKVATTLLNGPRYLHSTGQLHKGGPATGLYIIITSDEGEQLSIPGEKYSFAVLNDAQALGDFRSLSDHGRRVIRINLGKDVDKGLNELWQVVKTEKGK
jgi:transaldolase / glucose-6-phosphate isomerase